MSHVVSDYHEALNDVDACVICTPPHVHNAILKDCIATGRHILCEKTLSPSSPTHVEYSDDQMGGLGYQYKEIINSIIAQFYFKLCKLNWKRKFKIAAIKFFLLTLKNDYRIILKRIHNKI